ncbi:hypothetical protein ACIBCA_36505 [Kitasatospora sp. NPDC051170]|uniref:hypothetical protein n=1 Tax=Kitasatospora sp. NPDC051170 TaxID=3364056 RepID=UPI0037A7AF52
MSDQTEALIDAVCELTERVDADGWSPSATADTLGAVDALLQLLGRLGPEADTALQPALAATARVRALLAAGTLPAAPPARRRWQDGPQPGDRPEDWAERDPDVAERLWFEEQRALGWQGPGRGWHVRGRKIPAHIPSEG